MRWKDRNSYVTAEDRSGFFGAYALIFGARVTQDNLAKLRKNKGLYDGKVENDVSGMVHAVTTGEFTDENTSVIDQYAGKPKQNKPKPVNEEPTKTTKKSEKKKAAEKETDNGQDLIDDLF